MEPQRPQKSLVVRRYVSIALALDGALLLRARRAATLSNSSWLMICGMPFSTSSPTPLYTPRYMAKEGYVVHVLSDCITSYDKRKIDEMLQYYASKGCIVEKLSAVM